ncbi:hypothetical protein BH09BAC4_BH09BAC4_06610 [soil metagenome]
MKKVIGITGTSSGFGYLMVKAMANADHTVIATMRGIKDKNKDKAQALSALPGVDVLELDVASDLSVKVAIETILSKYQQIDVLINNAAIQGNGLLEAYSLEQFQRIINVNVYGIVRLYHQVLPAMRAVQNGLIINITSTAGRFSPPFQVPYNASKFAVEAITEGGYDELISQGIETVIIEPGAFMTEMYTKEGTHADRPQLLNAYGEQTKQIMSALQDKLAGAMNKYQPDPQVIADVALRLINMDKGTRPLRTSVDPIADGVDLEFNQATAEIKARWVGKYLA